MPAADEPALSLAEWVVLCLVREGPVHGFALARLLSADGAMGRIWRVPKPVIYRALQRLEELDLVRSAEQQPSAEGPAKTPVAVTPAGRSLASAWLARPVAHNRDVRSELLVKLALLDRTGSDPAPLLDAQQEQLVPLARAIRDRLDAATGFDRTLVLWRFETMSATLRFLDELRAGSGARMSRLWPGYLSRNWPRSPARRPWQHGRHESGRTVAQDRRRPHLPHDPGGDADPGSAQPRRAREHRA